MSVAAAAAVTVATNSCFHCGELLNGSRLHATINQTPQPVCCAGCLAVAELICGAGLDDYYVYRDQHAQRPDAAAIKADAWNAYSRPEMAAQFTRIEGDEVSALLLIEGLRCTACSWLIDKVLTRLDGIREISVNAAVGRAHVRWDPARIDLSQVLRTIARLGYRPQPLTAATIARAQQDEHRSALKRLVVAGFGMMQVMMFAVSTYSAELAAEIMQADLWSYFRIVSLLVTTPVLVYAGAPILNSAWRSIRSRSVGMDVPVSIALVLAYTASVWNTWRGSGEVYFDSVTMFIFFLTLGRFVEMSVRHRTAGVSDALAHHLPATAHRLQRDEIEDIATATLRVDDVVLVRAGEIIPADGEIIHGESRLDESMLTGESIPVRRVAGEQVSAGSVNVTAPIRLRVLAVAGATLLSGIVALLQRAQTQKPAIAQSADRAAARFLQGVLIASGAVCAAWMLVDPSRAFEATLAVLVVACPCAFAIAMPAALAAATGELARHGVLIARPDAIESLAKIDRVIFDKTGTLTCGQIRVERITPLADVDERQCLSIAAALERNSEHPVARAFQSIHSELAVGSVQIVPGCGIEGVIDNHRYRLGGHSYAAELCGSRMRGWAEDPGCTQVTLSDENRLLAVFGLTDAMRPGSELALQELSDLHIPAEILSGDGLPAVRSVAERCRITEFRARHTPDAKLQHVRTLQAQGQRIAMLGDGINDAPVLGAADIAIAMGRGAALAHASADMILISEDLAALPQAIRVARKTMRIARQNLCWAAAYNFCSLPLAALGYIPPWLAAIGMSVSSIAVILNAMRIMRGKRVRQPDRDGRSDDLVRPAHSADSQDPRSPRLYPVT